MANVIKFEDLNIPQLTEVAKESFEEALWATEKALAKQLEFGRVMLIVKAKLPYGEWGKWVRETFQDQMSLRNIQFHMKAHQEVAKNPSLLECANSLDEILTLTEKPRKPSVEVIEVATDEPHDIAAEVAAECGVTREQIIRDGEYAEALDIVSQSDPDIQAKVRSGKVTQDDVIATAKAVSNGKSATKSSPPPRHAGEHNESKVFAIGKADVAITQLKGIPAKNKFRDAALDRVQAWIESGKPATPQNKTAEKIIRLYGGKATRTDQVTDGIRKVFAIVEQQAAPMTEVVRFALTKLTEEQLSDVLLICKGEREKFAVPIKKPTTSGNQ